MSMTGATWKNRVAWLGELQKAQPQAVASAFDLVVEVGVNKANWEEIKAATITYIQASLGSSDDVSSDDAVDALIARAADELANRTPNGVVVPKSEFDEQFGNLHLALSKFLRSMGMDDHIDSVSCPIIVRMQKGASDAEVEARRYASTTVHLDVWGGDPADEVIVTMPILGDIERTTVEYFAPPEDIELRGAAKELANYATGAELLGEVDRYPLELKHGFVYFIDALVPHRTAKRAGGVRVNVEFRLRRRVSEAEKAAFEKGIDPARLAHFVSLNEWYSLGSEKQMHFLDTYEDAKNGIFTSQLYNSKTYTTVDR